MKTDISKTILLAEDDDSNRSTVRTILEKAGYRVLEAKNGREGLDVFRQEDVDLILTDLKMPDMDGIELLKAARLIRSDVDVILMTAHGTVETAVEAMKEGAYDFIAKPFKRATLLRIVEKVLEKRTLLAENLRLRQELGRYRAHRQIVGQSEGHRRLLEMIAQVAPSSATVLIEGESGTGKELVAEAIHQQSPRARKSFIKVSCAAIPETLLEAELFGYEKGAFTGALARKEGRFELAHEGTLFLDEVSEISPAIQVKLLRVLQEGEFERLGGTRTLHCDVRILAASNQNLDTAVQEKRFREDLFYRLNVIRVDIPPLRSRAEDIPLLANHFLRVYAAKNDKALAGIDEEALNRLSRYAWPGNIRELENVIERASVLCKGPYLSTSDLPEGLNAGPTIQGDQISIPIGMPLSDVETLLIQETLKRTKGDKNLTAKMLGIAPRTIYRKI